MKAFLWLLAVIATSILLVGLLTGFSYTLIDVQLHDTYYVFDASTGIVAFSITLLLVTMAFLPFKILAGRPVLKFLCVVVTGLIFLFPLCSCISGWQECLWPTDFSANPLKPGNPDYFWPSLNLILP